MSALPGFDLKTQKEGVFWFLAPVERTFEQDVARAQGSVTLHGLSREAVSMHIGDVNRGPQVRRMANQLGIPRNQLPTDDELGRLIAVYRAAHPSNRAAHPSSRLGPARALKALSLRQAPAPAALAAAPSAEAEATTNLLIEHLTAACERAGGPALPEAAGRWLRAAAFGGECAVPADLLARARAIASAALAAA